MGDFNMELDNPGMKYLQKIGYETPFPRLVDAWLSVHSGQSGIGTHHRFTGRAYCPRIDHITTSEHAQVLDAKIYRHALNGHYPSDHFPVTATIRVRTETSIAKKEAASKPQKPVALVPDT